VQEPEWQDRFSAMKQCQELQRKPEPGQIGSVDAVGSSNSSQSIVSDRRTDAAEVPPNLWDHPMDTTSLLSDEN
jgi:hypothetical protein